MAKKGKAGNKKSGNSQKREETTMNGNASTSAEAPMDDLNLNSPEAESSSTPSDTLDATPGPSREPVEVPNGQSSQAEEDQKPVDPLLQAELFKLEGNKAFDAKSYREAIDLYSKAIALNTINGAVFYLNRAAAYMAIKQFNPALSDCQKAASMQGKPPLAKTSVRLARCHLALGAPSPALTILRELLASDTGNVAARDLQRKALALEAHLRNLNLAQSKKDWAMARLALDKCIQAVDSESGEIPSQWRCWRIEHEIVKRNWDQATVVANEALRQYPNSADILTLRGLVLFLTGKLPGALQHAMQALRMDPDNQPAKKLRQRVKQVEALKDEGNSLFKANQWHDAIKKYSEALDVIGNEEEEGKGGQIRATLLSNRATTYLKLEDYDAALVDTNESIELYSLSYKALRTRARIYEKQGLFEEAIADFKSALDTADHAGATADVQSLRTELRKAEVLLKRSKSKDYYKILGVERECSVREIKKAYHRESLKHHPDKGGDVKQFQLVGEAHAVLSDPQRRNRYDLGEDEDGSMEGGPSFSPFGPDIASMFSGGPGGGFGGFRFSTGGSQQFYQPF